jgi:glutamyl-tRNA reductase
LRHFAKKGAQSVLVCNRSFARAEEVAKEFGGRPVAFDALVKTLVEADIVVSSTGSPSTILQRQEVESILAARRGRPLFLIDIAVPRDIDPEVQTLSNVYLYNIDHLEKLMRENLRLREQELARCQTIIQVKTEAFLSKLAPAQAAGLPNSAPSENKQFWLGQALEKLSSQGASSRKQRGCESAAVQLQPTTN